MNKQLITLALVGLSTMPANAQINGDGYYRIQNVKSGRYMTLCDNHSKGIDYSATQAETGALETRGDKNDIISDPGSVFYIKKISGNEYNIISQGADMHSMTNYYIKIIESSYTKGAYRAYQTSKGYALYLADKGFKDGISYVTTSSDYKEYRDWYITPVSTETDNFIGITPNIESDGKYFASFYTGFAYDLASSGMKAYYISNVDEKSGIAVYKEISGTIPAKTPVYIECSSKDVADNKIKPLADNVAAISGNKLTGVFFSVGNWRSGHYNSVPFDEKTMRSLNVEDGKLVYNTATDLMPIKEVCLKPGSNKDEDYANLTTIAHNTNYLSVANGTAASLKLLSEDEYKSTGINDITIDTCNKPANIYNLNGTIVRKNATSTEGLAKGIYLFNGKKIVVK